jgi:hypothetical protein
VTAKNGSGGVTGTITGLVSTANWTWPENTGRHVYVNAATGNDSNSGTSAGSPFRTIGRANALVAAGDTVHIYPGRYYKKIDVAASGTSGRPISFVFEGAGAIVDGSDPNRLRLTWTNEGGGVYSISVGTSLRDEYRNKPLMVVAGTASIDGPTTRLYLHDSLPELQNGYCLTDWNFWHVDPCIRSGYFVDHTTGKLYVKLDDGSDPSARHMFISRFSFRHEYPTSDSRWRDEGYGDDSYGIGIFGKKWIRIRNLEFRFFHETMKVKTWEPSNPNHYIRIADSRFRHFNRGISAVGVNSFSVYENNTFDDNRIFDWPRLAHKQFPNETCSIDLVTDSNWVEAKNNVVRNNSSDGAANGICVHTRNTDIHGTTVRRAADDGFEPDTAYGSTNANPPSSDDTNIFFTENLRFFSNTIDTVFSGISLSPIYGVTSVLGNTITNTVSYGVKTRYDDSYGPALIWNNTFYSPFNNPLGKNGRAFDWTATIWNFDLRNNVFFNRYHAVEGGYVNSPGSAAANRFDYNLGYTINSNSWSTIEDYYDSTGFPGIDRAVRIPGLHGDASDVGGSLPNCLNWSGTSPDIGAFEFSSGAPPDKMPPPLPSGLNVTVISSSQINLSWNAVTDPSGIREYRIERAVGAGSFALLRAVAGTSTSDTGLAASTTYRYRVSAVDNAGNASAFSTEGSGTTPATSGPNRPPTVSLTSVAGRQGLVTFSVSAAVPDGPALACSLAFGDGSASAACGASVAHRYAPGKYRACATATDSAAAKATACNDILVNKGLKVWITASSGGSTGALTASSGPVRIEVLDDDAPSPDATIALGDGSSIEGSETRLSLLPGETLAFGVTAPNESLEAVIRMESDGTLKLVSASDPSALELVFDEPAAREGVGDYFGGGGCGTASAPGSVGFFWIRVLGLLAGRGLTERRSDRRRTPPRSR